VKVRWTEAAFSELDDIFAFISQRSRSAAATVARRILDRATMLGDFPMPAR
jgi:plasmid stabilization system protein ParE